MPVAEDMRHIVDHIVSSYETRVQNIGTLFDTTHQILRGFQDSLLDTKQEREKLNAELRENLAKNKSLRRKDFEHMTEGIISAQNEREKEVRDLLNTYLNEQRAMARDLKENLGKFRDSLGEGEVQRVKEFQQMIKKILAKQTGRKDEVISKLKEFKKEQKMLASRLKELLAKGRDLRIKDLKRMLNELRGQYEERLARQEERKREVRQLLGERKKARN
jgi:molecular chaperone DnaK (HSP70)